MGEKVLLEGLNPIGIKILPPFASSWEKKFMNPIQIKLTKLLLWSERYKFKELMDYVLPNNQKVEIIIFKGKSPNIGATTLFKTIIINEDLFLKYSKIIQDYVIVHELGHSRFSNLAFVIISLVLLMAHLIKIFGFAIIIVLITTFIIPKFWIYICISLGIWGGIFLLIGLLITWKSEMDADFYAIKLLGVDKFISCKEEIKNRHSKISIRQRIENGLSYPPDKLIFYLWNKKYGGGGQ